MARKFRFYLVLWLVCLAFFNLVVFIAPGEKTTSEFWTGYGFITLAFVGQLICAYFAIHKHTLRDLFYGISVVVISYLGLVVMVVAGIMTMMMKATHLRFGIILCSAVLCVTAIIVLLAEFHARTLSTMDQSNTKETFSIRMLTSRAEQLMATISAPQMQKEVKAVCEALRYSDPMFHGALTFIHEQMNNALAELESAVQEGDTELVQIRSREMLRLIDERNVQCRKRKNDMLTKVYPAVIRKEEDYWIEFPNLPGCQTSGETLEETLVLAEEALGLYLKTLIDEGQPLPTGISIEN